MIITASMLDRNLAELRGKVDNDNLKQRTGTPSRLDETIPLIKPNRIESESTEALDKKEVFLSCSETRP
jgi:hypothetical protein